MTGQTFGIATTGPAINLLRIVAQPPFKLAGILSLKPSSVRTSP